MIMGYCYEKIGSKIEKYAIFLIFYSVQGTLVGVPLVVLI